MAIVASVWESVRKMTIIEALKSGKLYSIDNQILTPARWMYFDAPNFVVLLSRRGGSKILVETPDENEAVKWLIGEE